MPHIGVNSYHGDGAGDLGPGFRVGGLIGFRFEEVVSINGELNADITDTQHLPAGEHLSELDLSATLSPLFSIIDARMEWAFGPKLGFWLGQYNQTSVSRGDGAGTFGGLDLGANVAGMAQVGRRLWLGGLASFDLRTFKSNCYTPNGGKEGCATGDFPPADKVLALSLLLMFSV